METADSPTFWIALAGIAALLAAYGVGLWVIYLTQPHQPQLKDSEGVVEEQY